MSDLAKELEKVSRLKREETTTEVSARSIRKQADAKMDRIKKRIASGETTGDRIRDFVIMAHGGPNPEREKIYRDIEEKISEHAGEFILLISRNYEFHGCAGFGREPRPRDYILETRICLGILNGKKLGFDFKNHPQCKLPTSVYAYPWVQGKIEIKTENISDSSVGLGFYWSISQLDQPAKITNSYGVKVDPPIDSMDAFNGWRTEQNPKLEIKIGDVEVDAWFKENPRYQKTYEKLCAALGRVAEKTPENKKLQKQVLTALARLTGERMQVMSNLKDIFSCMHSRYESSDEHGIWLPREQHPWETSFKDSIKQLQDIELRIVPEVKLALELGLGHIESIRKLAQQYEVKK